MNCTHADIAELNDGVCPICPKPEYHTPERLMHDPGELLLDEGFAAKLAERKRKLVAERCTAKLSEFFREGWHVLEPNIPLEWHWHIESLCDHFQWMYEQWAKRVPDATKNLAINVPPGSLKSRIMSVYGPAWCWLPGNSPGMSFLCASTTPTVALRDADYMRELIESEWYRDTFGIDWKIDSGHDAKGLFRTTAGGIRQSQGMTAKVTGVRRDMLILDDPNDVKDISDIKLDAVEMSYQAMRNRVNDLRRSRRILIQQRTHERDLSGIVLKKKDWEHLCIPMHYIETSEEEPCPCGRAKCQTSMPGSADPRSEPGDVLQPERNTPEVLESEREGMGSLMYAGQMNQRPVDADSMIFKPTYWGRYDELPRDRRGMLLTEPGIISVDANMKEGGSSRAAIVVVFPHKALRYVDFCWAKSVSYPVLKKMLIDVYNMYWDTRDGAKGRSMIGKILIEKAANGHPLIAELSSELPGIIAVPATGPKFGRISAMGPAVEAGNVKVKRAPWDDMFIGEHASFPRGQYDDIPDAMAQAMASAHSKSTVLDRYRRLAKAAG